MTKTRYQRVAREILIICALALTSTAEAAQPGKYNLLGTGNLSCGSWTAYRRATQASLPEQWILGFLSGIGYEGLPEGDNPLNGVDANAVWAWMDEHCRTNPLDSLAASSAAFASIHPR